MKIPSVSEHSAPSFEEFAKFLRDCAGVAARVEIAPDTLFEDDLGISGDDGCDLLEATEKRFRVCLSSPEDGSRRTFDLAPHEFLFHGEGLGLDIVDLLSPMHSSVRPFTVGELFEAVKEAPPRPIKRESVLGLDD